MFNQDKLQRFGFRKSKATRGLCAAVLGSFILMNGANVQADTLFNGETQQTPISRADISTLSDADKARIVKGQIDEQMSWIDENGNITWITDFVLVYEKSGECSVVPYTDVTPPENVGGNKVTTKTVTPAKKILQNLPKAGDLNSTTMLVAGIGLASLAGYMLFKNKKTGKTIAVAMLIAGGVGFGTTALAEATGFLDVVEQIQINLDSRFTYTAEEDDCWKYVGYIPNIASKPGEEPVVDKPVKTITVYRDENGKDLVPPVEGDKPAIEIDGFVPGEPVYDNSIKIFVYAPKEVTEVPNEAPKHEIPKLTITVYKDPDGNDLVPPVEGDQPAIEIDGFVPGEPVYENGIKIFTYTPKEVTEVPNEAPKHEVPKLTITVYKDPDGNDLVPPVEGDKPAIEIDGFVPGEPVYDNGIKIFVYTPKEVTEVPGEAPKHEAPKLTITVYRDPEGNHLVPPVEGDKPAIEIDGMTPGEPVYDNGIKTYVYTPNVVTEVPSEAPTHEIPAMTITVYRDPEGNDLVPPVEGDKPAIEIDGFVPGEPVYDNGVKIFTYTPEVTEIPNEAPTHDVPEATIEQLDPVEERGTVIVNYVDEQGNLIKASNTLISNELVNVINRTKVTTNGVETIIGTPSPTGTTYDAEPLKDSTINFSGRVYEFTHVKDGSADVVGTIVTGTSTITYVYRHVPQVTTREETSQVTGDVVVKYVDTNGVEIKTPFTLVDDGVVSNTTTTITITDGKETSREDNTVPTGLTYDSTTQKPTTIDFNGVTYTLKQLKDGDNETGNVVEGTTTVTYIYERVPVVTTREETSQVTGDVIVKYVDTNGVEIKNPVNLVDDGVVSNTTTTITVTDGTETNRENNTVPTGLTYDSTPVKDSVIEYNGAGYRFKELKSGDTENGTVVEGTTTVTYIYEVIPNTTEVTREPVYGNVVTRYINDVTGQEIVTGSNIVTQGLVAERVTTVEKNWKGEIVSTNTVVEPTGLTYETTTDKAVKDAEIATLRTAPLEYINTETGELIQAGTEVPGKAQFITRMSLALYDGESYYGNGVYGPNHVIRDLAAVNGDLSRFDVYAYGRDVGYGSGRGWKGVDKRRQEAVNDIERVLNNVKKTATTKGYNADDYKVSVTDGKYIITFTKDSTETVVPQANDVPYEYVGVDELETGTVEEGTKVITYRYRPRKANWTPGVLLVEEEPLESSVSYTFSLD